MNRSAALRCGSTEIASRRAGSESGAPTGFMAPMGVQCWRWRLPMKLVAADVRRLTFLRGKEVRASLRRLLRFRGSMREDLLGRILSRVGLSKTCIKSRRDD